MHASKILSLAAMARLRRKLRAQGKRVVVTNGVFDILHVGHISYLRKARSFGDVLVVGLNGDKSVRLLKGALRPILPQRERAELLAALECVDHVVVFQQKRCDKLLAALQPDTYVKGGDYTLDTLDPNERRAVEHGGGKIKIVPFVRGRSTTDIIGRILDRFGSRKSHCAHLDTVTVPPKS
jgi:D-beta-D-heptose 7-phosphate kinase/D-beta-D-heptose 1-phosphate adenosyltransferase